MATSHSEITCEFYRNILEVLGLTLNPADGAISHAGIDYDPLDIDGKKIYLPTDENVRRFNNETSVLFHPLCENIFEGMSPVVQKLREAAMCQLNKTILITMYALTLLMENPESQKGLSSKQITTLGSIENASGVDEKFRKNLSELAKKVKPKSPNQLINIFLSHNGKIGEEEYLRTAYVTFPFFEELENSDSQEIFGVKFRRKDLPILKSMFLLMFDKAGIKDAYSFGTTSKTSPYLFAVMGGFTNAYNSVYKITKLFEKQVKNIMESEHPLTPASSIGKLLSEEIVDNAIKSAKYIPAYPYNTGDAKATQVPQEPAPVATGSTIGDMGSNPAPRVAQPVPAAPTAPVTSRGGELDWLRGKAPSPSQPVNRAPAAPRTSTIGDMGAGLGRPPVGGGYGYQPQPHNPWVRQNPYNPPVPQNQGISPWRVR